MVNIEVLKIKDTKKEIEFWLNALSNPKVDKETVVLLNKCMQSELYKYLNPMVTFKTDVLPKEE